MHKKPPRKQVKAIPYLTFSSKEGSIELRDYKVTITGTLEGAALALSEDILKQKKFSMAVGGRGYWNYRCIDVFVGEDKQISLKQRDGIAVEFPEWETFKKEVETICNKLVAFL